MSNDKDLKQAVIKELKLEPSVKAGDRLTPRSRQVMDRMLAGHPSKNIAADLCISQRTVENHRSGISAANGVYLVAHWRGWPSGLPRAMTSLESQNTRKFISGYPASALTSCFRLS